MGVAIGTSTLCCLNIQQTLDASRDPGMIRERLGFLEALRSPANTRGFEQITFFEEKARPGANALPKTEVIYRKPTCSTVSSTAGSLCDSPAASADRKGYLTPTITLISSVGGSFTKDTFNQLCESPDERLLLDLEDAAFDIKRDMNAKLLAAFYPLMGNYANGDSSIGATAKSLNIISDAGHANAAAWAEFKREFRKQHTDQAPIVVGGEILGMFFDIKDLGGLGPGAIGANPNATNAMRANQFYDNTLDTVVQGIETDTDSHAISWIPGAVQLMEWYQYRGYREELNAPLYTETTLVIDGMTYDYTLRYKECDHEWVWTLTKHYDLFTIPAAAYAPCFDFNHKLHWKFGCGAFSCAQINV